MITKLDSLTDIATEFNKSLSSAQKMNWYYDNKNPYSEVQPVMGGGRIKDWIWYDHSASDIPTAELLIYAQVSGTTSTIYWTLMPGTVEVNDRFVMLASTELYASCRFATDTELKRETVSLFQAVPIGFQKEIVIGIDQYTLPKYLYAVNNIICTGLSFTKSGFAFPFTITDSNGLNQIKITGQYIIKV